MFDASILLQQLQVSECEGVETFSLLLCISMHQIYESAVLVCSLGVTHTHSEWMKAVRWTVKHAILQCIVIYITKTKQKCRSSVCTFVASILIKRLSQVLLIKYLINWSSAVSWPGAFRCMLAQCQAGNASAMILEKLSIYVGRVLRQFPNSLTQCSRQLPGGEVQVWKNGRLFATSIRF